MNYYTLSTSVEARERSILRNVYMWMTGGLVITGLVAHGVASNEALLKMFFSNYVMFFGIIIAQLVLVFVMSARVMKMSVGAAVACFTGYSILTGITMSFIFLMYTSASIASTFFITAGTFAGMSLYAVTTKRDLSSIGSYLFMGLIGIIIASLVNFFLKSQMLYWIITYAGVAVFVGLTVYDTQTIKRWNQEADTSNEDVFMRLSILGALRLYLDFINLFLYFLRLFGRRN